MSEGINLNHFAVGLIALVLTGTMARSDAPVYESAPIPKSASVNVDKPSYVAKSATAQISPQTGFEFIDTSFENASPLWYDFATDGTIIHSFVV